jgi:multidrug efflux pump subunit AcrA (membrane-fusion protein)
MLSGMMGAALLGLAGGCQQSPAPAQSAAAEVPPPASPQVTVALVYPQRKTVRRVFKRPGYNIEAYQRTPLYAKISGYVRKWNVDMGDRVRKDQVMAELWVPEMEVELQQKKAAIDQAEAEIGQARASVLRARAEYDRTKSQAERLARVGVKVIDQENVEEARLGFESSKAGMAKAEADVKAAEARLQVARKAHDYTRTLLQYTKIRAPFDGVVTQRALNEGDFVQPVAGRKGDALFVVEQVDPVRVFIDVPEMEAVWLRDGVGASVRSQSLPGQEFRGSVTRTSRSLNPSTRTLRTEVDLPNPEGALLPGLYVDVTITVEHRDVWTLPASAVVTKEDESFCYRLENGKTVRTPLRLGLSGGGLAEILKKQMKASKPGVEKVWEDFTGREEVITSSPSTLTNGQAVVVSHNP